jgi:hypothetical protein
MLKLVREDFSANISNGRSRWSGNRHDRAHNGRASLRSVVRFALSMAALILLANSAPLQAQSDLQAFDREGCGGPPAVFDAKFSVSTAPPGIIGGTTSSAIEGPTPARLVGPSVFFLGRRCVTDRLCSPCSSTSDTSKRTVRAKSDLRADRDQPGDSSKAPAVVALRKPKPPGINESVFYKNRLEFSLDSGWLPINIPFVFDVFMGDAYTMTSLKYTLVPVIASLRWQLDDVDGPWIFRGNWDLETSAGFTFIPRGPETRYISWIMGIRRNFVPRRGRVAPYFDGRLGLGDINAKEPSGVLYAQGQNFTFTVNMGSGVRYNFNSRYSISAGLNWMHISNLYLSEPQFSNYGINVYGPMFGIDVRLGKPRLHSSQ